jgi:Uma2 family endonuclease
MRDNETPMRTEATKKLFTVAEYYKIVEAGVFPDRVRTELIDGEIIEMTGMGVAHAMAITRASHILFRVFGEKAEVRVQLPLPLSRFSEVAPDLCLVSAERPGVDIHHPEPPDVLLVVEVPTRHCGRSTSNFPSASAGVAEVWMSDPPNQILHVYREPSGRVLTGRFALSKG